MDKRGGRPPRSRFASRDKKLQPRLYCRELRIKEPEVRRGSNRHELLEMLCIKLQSIEEDMKLMKMAVARCIEERSELMREISHQRHSITGCLAGLHGGEASAAASSSSSSSVSSHEGGHRSGGLAEVLLLQDSRQSLVTRGMTVDLEATQNLAWNL